jgi:hypothetical protein
MTVEENVYARLRSCAGRPDWFALDLAARERLEVELEHESGVDLDLYLYRASDLQLLAVDQRRELQTSVRYLGDRSQRVLLEVRPVRFEDARYDLSVSLEADACREDSYEENDSLDEAATLPLEVDQTTALPLRICGADEDWFRLPALADSGGLRIEAVDAPDGLRLELLGPSGGPALSADPDDGVLAILRLGSGGDYLHGLAHSRSEAIDIASS